MASTAMVPAISDYRVMLSGKATFTLESSGKRYTYRVNRVESEQEGRDPSFFVSLLTGQDNQNNFTYMGLLQARSGVFMTTKASKLPINSDPCRGIAWLALKLFNNQALPVGVRLLWANQCQRCGRKLTVPSSIDARLGPECAGKV